LRRVIVDTSVFVEFFTGRRVPHFESSLRNNAALLSPYVRLELLQGVRKNEASELGELLGGIPQVPQRDELFPLAERMIGRLKGTGLTLGVVDLLIAAQAELFGCLILSFDAVFRKLEKLGMARTLR